MKNKIFKLFKTKEKVDTRDKILMWLQDIDSSWSRRKNSKNCFYSDSLEAIFVYEKEIKYWRNITKLNSFLKSPIPLTKLHLEKIVNKQENNNLEKTA